MDSFSLPCVIDFLYPLSLYTLPHAFRQCGICPSPARHPISLRSITHPPISHFLATRLRHDTLCPISAHILDNNPFGPLPVFFLQSRALVPPFSHCQCQPFQLSSVCNELVVCLFFGCVGFLLFLFEACLRSTVFSVC